VLLSVATHVPFEGVGRAVSLSRVDAISAPLPAARAADQSIVMAAPLPAATPTVVVSVSNLNTDETATFAFGPGGQLEAEQAPDVMQFFRCRRTGRQMPLAPGVLTLLEDVARRFPGHVIEIVSGFRAPPYGAPHSKHFQGHAIDLRVRGVKSTVVRDFVWREHKEIGVGYYPHQNFVHVDTRPGEPDMAWTASGEDSPPKYRPSWAYSARHPRPSRADRRAARLASRLVASLGPQAF
jgi:uncharacterized protein YcbK (DUF882 family)